MTKIQVMPLSLSNQIAAGEVVERPASVIKELVENAIDAGASQIIVRVVEAGLLKIEVVDNGSGIASEDVARAFERHATSKLYEKEDLFRIRSLGFRGEALPSIASVSEMTLETSTGKEAGRRLSLKGGEIIEDQPASSRKGTAITVENLFFNTPARLKYIKSPKTEMTHISDLMNRFSFARPDISFQLYSDGSLLLNTVGNGDLRQAIAGVYGVSTAKKMLPIQAENFNYKVRGYVSSPDMTRASNKYITLVVNQRVIRNFKLTKAISQGYGSKLMVNRYPIAVVHMDMDPLLLDVNVHPTKQQVRISDENELAKLVEEAVADSLKSANLIPEGLKNIRANQEARQEEKAQHLPLDLSVSSSQVREDLGSLEDRSDSMINQLAEPSYFSKDLLQELSEPVARDSMFEASEDSKQDDDDGEAAKDAHEKEARFPELEYFGQMHGTYLFAQNEEGLYIIDQHAAQERIKYEYLRVEIGKEDDHQQDLLIPLVLEYPISDYVTLKEKSDQLESVGLYLEDFGEGSFILQSYPTWINEEELEETVRDMIDYLLVHDQISLEAFREETAIMMSCKQSIKANHYLPAEEARQLLLDLSQCDNPYNCPHGRPVLVHLPTTDIEKMFKRIQDQ